MSNNGATIGILVVAHGPLANGLVGAAEEIMGPQRGLKGLTLKPGGADPKAQFKDAAKDLESGGGVLVLTDLFGGTPSNVALAACPEAKLEVVTGVNLPLLLRALSKREALALGDLAVAVADYGRQQILTPNHMLEKTNA